MQLLIHIGINVFHVSKPCTMVDKYNVLLSPLPVHIHYVDLVHPHIANPRLYSFDIG